MVRTTRCLPVILAAVLVFVASQASPVLGATRHHFYVGTITAISSSTLVIYSKAHHTSFRFAINGQTKFLKSGKAISRLLFKTGAYVTVSYSAGPHGTMTAWHVSLRK